MRIRLVGGAALLLAACATTTASAPVAPLGPLRASSVSTEDLLRALQAVCLAESSAQPGKVLEISSGMGTGGFKVDSENADAQAWFNYGLQLSHAFYHADAVTAMKQAVKADPTCALCAWGEAWAEGPTLNYGIEDAQRVVALASAERARGLVKPGDEKAKRLIDAVIARYADPKAASGDRKTYLGTPPAGKGGTDPAFGKAMQAIAADYPDDLELSVLAAHAMLIPVRGDDESLLKPALALLESVLKQRPDDTGAIHYYIHATEFDDRPEDAIAYADKLGTLAPEASHLVHMPAHTYFHAGRYEDAAVVNAEAISADVNWVREGGAPAPPSFLTARKPKAGKGPSTSSAAQAKAAETETPATPLPPMPMYYAHNLSFGLAGALMAGDADLALKYASHAELVYAGRPVAQRAYPVPRTYVALARFAPDKALAIAETEGDPRFAVYRHYARGEALLTKGDIAGALAEAKAIGAVKGVNGEPEPKLARWVIEGRVAEMTGQPKRAAQIFLKAAKLQEKTLKDSWDPPAWWYPVRRSAAAAYLKAGDFAKAEAEATGSLKTWKHDPLALWVLGKAEQGLGKAAEGAAHLEDARKIWRGDFDSITVEAI